MGREAQGIWSPERAHDSTALTWGSKTQGTASVSPQTKL